MKKPIKIFNSIIGRGKIMPGTKKISVMKSSTNKTLNKLFSMYSLLLDKNS